MSGIAFDLNAPKHVIDIVGVILSRPENKDELIRFWFVMFVSCFAVRHVAGWIDI